MSFSCPGSELIVRLRRYTLILNLEFGRVRDCDILDLVYTRGYVGM